MGKPEKSLREKLAELEHEQWMHWSKALADEVRISPQRLHRWAGYWRPYDDLPELAKAADRKWADKILVLPEIQSALGSQERLNQVIYQINRYLKSYPILMWDDVHIDRLGFWLETLLEMAEGEIP